MNMKNRAIALGFAGALAIGVTSASAGPMPVTSGVKAAANDHVTEVRWRGGGWHGGWRGGGIGPGLAFGLAAGALAGAAVAGTPYGYYDYDYGYYGAPVYADPYGYDAPVYAPAPGYYGSGYYGYGYRGCYTNEGYGRRRPCDAN